MGVFSGHASISLKRQLFAVQAAGYLILCLILGGYSWYSLHSYSEDLKQANSRVFDSYLDSVNSLIMYTDNFLQSVFVNNLDFSNLVYNQRNVDRYVAVYNILKLCDVQLDYNKNLSALYVIWDFGSQINYRTQDSMPFDEKEQLKKFVCEKAESGQNMDQWYIADTDPKPMLVKLIGMNGVYLAAAVDFESVVADLSNTNQTAVRPSWVFCSGGRVIDDIGSLASRTELRTDDEDAYKAMKNKLGKDYIFRREVSGVCSEGSGIQGEAAKTDLVMYMLLPGNNFASLTTSQIIIVSITVICAVIGILTSVFLKYNITRPLDQLMSTMNAIKDGAVEAKAEDARMGYKIEEFSLVNRTFNEMMEQIRTLKMKAYEEALENQKICMGYLQLQIKPHFYLNCLKTLYALAYRKKYEHLQGMIIEISKHLRYMFKNTSEMVHLSEELNFTENYVHLMCHNGALDIHFETNVADHLRTLKVPPLILQTFVENSVKYAGDVPNGLWIKVKIILLEGDGQSENAMDYLDIKISDNGQGYDEDILQILNGNDSDGTERKKGFKKDKAASIGIDNLKKRIRLLYGSSAEFVFMNDGGAVSEMMLPIAGEGEEKDLNEDIDC